MWFEKNGWIKPRITLPKLKTTITSKILYASLQTLVDGGYEASATLVKMYFMSLLKDVKETLNFNWVSMGVMIGYNNQPINPFNLVTISFVAGMDQVVVESGDPSTNEYIELMLLIVGSYRLKETRVEMHKERIRAGLGDLLSTQWFKDRIDSGLITFAGAFGDEDLIKLFCTVDMFHTLFPNSLYARIRFGTLGFAFKHCSVLFGASLTGMRVDQFAKWLLTTLLRQVLYRINRDRRHQRFNPTCPT